VRRAFRLAAAVASIQCVDVQPFVCADASDCRRGAAPGVCEPTSYCSYPDEECASGRRYSDLAGPFANECTEPDVGTTTSSTSSTSSSSSESSSSSDASTGIDPVCGDGTQDPDEECDDGNDQDGDGCNANCIRAGALLWSDAVAGSDAALDSGQAITSIASGDVAVVGWLADTERGDDVWMARYDTEGEQAWSLVDGNATAQDRGFGVAQASSADLFFGGFIRDAGSPRAWLGVVSPDGEPVEEILLVGQEVQAVSAFNNRVVAVGRFAGGAFVEARQLDGDPQWRVESDETNDILFAIHATATDEAYVVGRKQNDAWLARATPTSITTIDLRDGPASETDWAQGVVALDDRIVTAGLLIGELAGDTWIAGYDRAVVGPPLWEYEGCTEATPVQDEAEALAVEPGGDLIVVGFTTLDDRDAWIAKLTVEGDCVWERSYPELEGDTTARSVAVGSDGRIFVTGDISGPDGSIDAWVAAFAP
jgi:cysteine-rich repeat protein